MLSEMLDAELASDPFHPLSLRLVNGAVVDVPMPYLAFIQRRSVYVAFGVRRDTPLSPGVELIPLQDIAAVERPAHA
jgi:hypothetical protein